MTFRIKLPILPFRQHAVIFTIYLSPFSIKPNTMSKNKKNVKIRKYEKADHDVVCRIFYNGLMENWLQSYKRTINLGAPLSSLTQFIQLYAVFQYLQSFLWFLLAEFFIQSLVMFICFYRFWALAWEHLSTDLRDKEISQWTCRGLTKAGLFVATIDDEVVGMVCYSVKVQNIIQILIVLK